MVNLVSNRFDPVPALIDYHDAIQKLDFTRIENWFAEGAQYVSAGVGSLKGRAEIMAAFTAYFAIHGDQVAHDTSIAKLDDYTPSTQWSLVATNSDTGTVSRRSGTQTIHFNTNREIIKVDVRDDN